MTTATKPARVRSRIDLTAALSALAETQNELKGILEHKLERANELDQEFAAPVADLEAEIDAQASRIYDYVIANREGLFSGSRKIVVQTGEIATRNTPLKAVVEDADALIEWLVDHRRDEYIRTTRAPDLSALKKDQPTDVPHIAYVRGEQLIITPNESGLPVKRTIEES